MYYNGKDMNLKEYMSSNNDLNKNSIYYNETFYYVVLDYFNSYEPSEEDYKFLKENGYYITDFLDE